MTIGRATSDDLDKLHGLVARALIVEMEAAAAEGKAPNATIFNNALKLLTLTRTDAAAPPVPVPGHDPLKGVLPQLPPVDPSEFAATDKAIAGALAPPARPFPKGAIGLQPKD